MKTNHQRFTFLLLAIASLTACDGYSSGPDGDGASVVGGTYTGTVTISGSPLNVTFTLSQNGDAVTGSFVTDVPTSGTLSATLDGTSATFTISQTTPCAGTFTGEGTVTNSGGRISGSYTGTSSCTGAISATFVVNRVAGTGPPGY